MMILCLAFVWLLLHTTNALRWNSSLGIKFEKVISLKLTSKDPQIDVYHEEEIIIKRDIQSYLSKIVIYCLIAGYNEKSDILYRFCKDDKCSVEHQDGIAETHEEYGMSVKIETNLPKKKGMRIHLSVKPIEIDISGNYYCNVVDKNGHFAIRSNNIQIRDIIFWEQNTVRNENNIKRTYQMDINLSDLPLTLPCFERGLDIIPQKPEWILQEFNTLVFWSICPVKNNFENLQAGEKMTFSICRRFTGESWKSFDKNIMPRDIKSMTNWKYYINTEGQLNLFHFEDPYGQKMSYTLMCYTTKRGIVKPISTYIKQYTDDEIVSGLVFKTDIKYDKTLKAISPSLQHVSIYARQIPPETNEKDLPLVAIYAKYSARLSATYKWLFNGYQLNNGADRIIDRYKVNFIGDITAAQAGNYTLLISDNEMTISMTFIVKVLGPPILTNSKCFSQIQYVWELDDITLKCTYKNRPSELKIKINEEELQLNTHFKSGSEKLLKNYPYLSKLNFTVNPANYVTSDTVTMIYEAFQLKKSQGQTLYQDHTITFFAQNNLGLSVKSTSIYVLPKLEYQIEEFPYLTNCTSFCSSSDRHEFRCRLKTTEYASKELIIDHYWTVNGHRLNKLSSVDNLFVPYFLMDPETKDLVLLPINSTDKKRDDFVKEALMNNFIICHIDLFSSDKSVSDFKYSSSDDIRVENRLKARITLDIGTTYVAYVTWIVVIVLIVVLAIIAVFLISRRLKNKGEVYQLEKLDRKWGHDTEKELEEETFQPYKYNNNETEIQSVNSSNNSEDYPPDNQL